MTKALKKAFKTASSLPEKEQDLLADILLTVIERSKGPAGANLSEIARRGREEAARMGMTEKKLDELMANG